MGNIKIIKGVFDTKLELEHAGVAAGFPILTDDYSHETQDFNRDYIKHPAAVWASISRTRISSSSGILILLPQDTPQVLAPALAPIRSTLGDEFFSNLRK